MIAPHIDQADYFSKTIRLHFPVTSNENVWMFCAGRCYRMRPGEIWALNNSTLHGVVNADAQASRMHMICDFLASPGTRVELLASADRASVEPNAAIEAQLYRRRATQARRRMIATGRFVYVHLHKSGGTFVNECLQRFFPDARRLGYHLPASLIPADLKSLPVLGFVRSPWSYYVSWYTFQSQMAQPNALFRCVSENRRLDFPRHDPQPARSRQRLAAANSMRLLQLLPAAYGNQGLNLPGFALAPIRGSGKGFYSYLFDYMYGGSSVPATVGRVEDLRADLLDFLEGLGPTDSRRTCAHSSSRPRRAIRRATAATATIYDDALAALVAERDRR